MKTRTKKPARVTGLGGVFLKARNPRKLGDWYHKHLGLPVDEQWCGCSFRWRHEDDPRKSGATVWSLFDPKTKYFGRGRQQVMLNYRVANLKRVLARLRREGVWVDAKTEVGDFGKFGWIKDGEGNRIELWEPPHDS